MKKLLYSFFILFLLLQPLGAVFVHGPQDNIVQTTFSVKADKSQSEALNAKNLAESNMEKIAVFTRKAYTGWLAARDRGLDDASELQDLYNLGIEQSERGQGFIEDGNEQFAENDYEDAWGYYRDVFDDSRYYILGNYSPTGTIFDEPYTFGFRTPNQRLNHLLSRNDLNINDVQKDEEALAKADENLKNARDAAKDACWNGIGGINLDACFKYGASFASFTMLWVSKWFLGIAAFLLDYAATYTVFNLSSNLESYTAIENAWILIRDMANISLIFILLYIAIGTILQLEKVNTSKQVIRVIVIGLLINFSFFFTEVIIDAGNIFATQFYNLLLQIGGENGISGAITQGTGVTGLDDASEKISEMSKRDWGVITVWGIGGFILHSIFAFVLFAISFILISRFVIFIFLLITSAGAFALGILPATAGYASKWWNALIKNSIIAPLMFMFIWLTVTLMTTADLLGHGSLGEALTNPSDNSALVSAGQTKEGSDVGNGLAPVFNYLVAMAFLLGSIVISTQLGTSGSKVVSKWGKNLNKKVGTGFAKRTALRAGGSSLRGTIGRGAMKAEETLSNSRMGNYAPVRGLRNITTGAAANAKFGTKMDSKEAAKKRSERLQDQGRLAQLAQERRREKLTDLQNQALEEQGIDTEGARTNLKSVRADSEAKRAQQAKEASVDVGDKVARNQLVREQAKDERQARAEELKKARRKTQEQLAAEKNIRNTVTEDTKIGQKVTAYDQKQEQKPRGLFAKTRKERQKKAKEYKTRYKQERKKEGNENKSVKEVFDTMAKQDKDKKKKENLLREAVKEEEKEQKKASNDAGSENKPSQS